MDEDSKIPSTNPGGPSGRGGRVCVGDMLYTDLWAQQLFRRAEGHVQGDGAFTRDGAQNEGRHGRANAKGTKQGLCKRSGLLPAFPSLTGKEVI